MNSFNNDKFDGLMGEMKVAEILASYGFQSKSTISQEYQPDYDLLVTRADGVSTTVEVKYDKYSAKSGLLAIEVGRKQKTKIKDSGITISKARFYCFVLPSDDTIYIIPTSYLRSIISGKQPITNNDKKSQGLIVLIEKNNILKHCRKFKKKEEEKNTCIFRDIK